MAAENTPVVGLLGGMSWHSTVHYYRRINEVVAAERGGHASARLLLSSLDFAEIRAMQCAEDWEAAGAALAEAAAGLERAGATCVAIATNLMHKVAPAVEARVSIPLVHIADTIVNATRRPDAAAPRTLGIVGTKWTMSDTFYADRLALHGVRALAPSSSSQAELDRIIFDELTRGVVTPMSRATYARAFADLAEQGAEAIVLACTEIMLLVDQTDSPVPLVDSCAAHSDALAEISLGRALAHDFAPGRLERREHAGDRGNALRPVAVP